MKIKKKLFFLKKKIFFWLSFFWNFLPGTRLKHTPVENQYVALVVYFCKLGTRFNKIIVFKPKKIGIKHIVQHDKNLGYGGNQKSCYTKALALGGDIVIILHPDYQYTPMLLKAMISIIGNGLYPVVFASRILGKGALKGGMPIYKYIANRFLTLFQNILINYKLSENFKSLIKN